MKKKPIFSVSYATMFAGGLSTATQMMKADDEDLAMAKFKKLNKKVSEDDIFDVSLLDTSHKHYRILASKAK